MTIAIRSMSGARLAAVAVLAATVLLGGCAATVNRNAADVAIARMPATAASKLVLNVTGSPASTGASDWNDFRLEWSENFMEQARLAGIPFEMQAGPAKPTGQDGTLLSVFVTDYRFLRPGTRYAVGVLAGNAYIESKMTFADLRTGATYGEQTANTTSSAWQGVFSAMTNRQVEAIAADVMKQLKSGQAPK